MRSQSGEIAAFTERPSVDGPTGSRICCFYRKTLSRCAQGVADLLLSPLHTTLTITRIIVNCRIFDIAIHLIMAIMTIIDRIVIIIHSAPDRRHWPEANTINDFRLMWPSWEASWRPLGACWWPLGSS